LPNILFKYQSGTNFTLSIHCWDLGNISLFLTWLHISPPGHIPSVNPFFFLSCWHQFTKHLCASTSLNRSQYCLWLLFTFWY
jgi:hypothetical protein